MALISSTLVLRLLTLTRLYAAYLLLTSPATLLTQNLILILGSAMRLPLPQPSTSNSSGAVTIPTTPTTATALAALALAFFALSDLATTTLPEFAYDEFWSVQCVARIAAFFGVASWVYVTKPAGTAMGIVEDRAFGRRAGDGLRNGVVFAWCFVEMTAMGWVFVVLREERKERARKILEEQEREREKRERGL